MNALVRAIPVALAGAALFVACAPESSPPRAMDAVDGGGASRRVEESASAGARIEEVRARFWVAGAPAVAGPAATYFEPSPGVLEATHLRAALPTWATRGAGASSTGILLEPELVGVTRAASVDLPRRADGEAILEDPASRVSVRFRLRDASAAPVSVAAGYALYARALAGADVVHRVHAEGTEDYVVFDERPAREELVYDVDVSRVAGLRLVGGTLEFLDDRGSPALRVAPPYVVDATGERRAARLAVSGCAYEANGGAPWGHRVAPPGAERCAVHVAWSGAAYPAVVDPAWGATGSMATPRSGHTASVLSSGKVLVAGGTSDTSAEIFDPAAGGGVGAFAATGSMSKVGAGAAAVLSSGKVLVVRGDASADLFDPTANGGVGAFAPTASTTARSSSFGLTASVLPSGKVLVAVGGLYGDLSVFDPSGNGGAGTFTSAGTMGERWGFSASVLSSGKVLIAGGYNHTAGAVASAFLLDATGASTGTGSLTAVRWKHQAVVLPSGKVLVVGGANNSSAPLATAEIYDPAANAGAGAFGTSNSMGSPRSGLTATLLSSGKVLVSGGTSSTTLASAELFDPAASLGIGGFAPAPAMGAARAGHSASLLSSGAVLVAGGTNGSALPSAEIFGGARGDACTRGAYCLSGFCADGVCCDTACGGACDRCNLAGKEGTCTPAPLSDPGVPACAAPYVCDGASPACATSCASDGACAPNYYCAPDGTCHARKPQGSACNPQDVKADCMTAGCRECASGNCVDGFCCDAACNGTCEACAAALKQSGTADGTCGPTKDGTDPRNECPTGAEVCGPDGMCNGTGGCRPFAAAGVSCGAGTCDATVARGQLCDGAGTCASNPAGVECAPFLCENGGCTTTCAGTSQCAAGAWCSAGKCQNRSADGKACTADEQCANGHCVDGVCCNAKCDGQCEACDVKGAEGTCAPVSGAPHGTRAACTQGSADAPCAAAVCDGTNRTACAGLVGSSVACGAATCADRLATFSGTCDGKGGCTRPAAVKCSPYACGATACNTTCSKDDDCAADATCDAGKCVSRATCDGDHTTTGANGATQDCTPYKCDTTGVCRDHCVSVADCVAPAVCDATGKCVPPAESTGTSGGGCSAASARTDGRAAPWAAVFALLVCRRRRTRARTGGAPR